MNQNQYRRFLNNPVTFMNGGPVTRFRINMSPGGAGFANSIKSTSQVQGGVPLSFQHSDARVTPMSLRYDDTGIPQTSALWATTTRPPAGDYVTDRAYYLQWSVDRAYAIELGSEAQLFVTARIDGCGILVFETPKKLIVVHHNVQVAAASKSRFQKMFESQEKYNIRNNNYRFDVRAQALQALSEQIIADNPDIIGGTSLDARQYMATGQAASVFGVKRDGRWRIFLNSKTGLDYRTSLMYG